jgi:hypothetical protein
VEDTVVDEGAGRAERHTLRLAWLQISRIECLIYRCRRVRSGPSVHPGDGGADLHLHFLRGKLEFLHCYCGTPWGGCLRHGDVATGVEKQGHNAYEQSKKPGRRQNVSPFL